VFNFSGFKVVAISGVQIGPAAAALGSSHFIWKFEASRIKSYGACF
jgi:hypothetical protein